MGFTVGPSTVLHHLSTDPNGHLRMDQPRTDIPLARKGSLLFSEMTEMTGVAFNINS